MVLDFTSSGFDGDFSLQALASLELQTQGMWTQTEKTVCMNLCMLGSANFCTDVLAMRALAAVGKIWNLELEL